ncbi:MAG: hypothetical protein ACI9EF_003675 [Pseudohongiellaceae bacterium]|jgi:hypothetical protein
MTDHESHSLPRWAWLALVIIVCLGVQARADHLDALPLFGDEFHSLDLVSRPFSEIAETFDQRGTHIALPMLQRLSQQALGPGVFALRLPTLLAGVLSLLLCFRVAKPLVGSMAALLSTAALALSPMHLYYSRFGRGYMLALLLGLLLVHATRRATLLAMQRVTRQATLASPPPGSLKLRSWSSWLPVILLAALLPYVHLSALTFVGTVALASMGLSWSAQRRLADCAPALIAFASGGLLTAFMYWPALAPLRTYLTQIDTLVSPGDVQAHELATLLAGGRLAGYVWLGAIPLALLWMLRGRSHSVVWLVAAMAGPLLGLAISAPYGMSYAYARYLFVGLPFAWMALAWLVTQLVGSRHLAAALGLSALAALFVSGPASPLRTNDFPFANSYLALRELPAFDEAEPHTAEFYRMIADDDSIERIIEAPLLMSRAVLLYRNGLLQHGKPTLAGTVADLGGPLSELPYVPILNRAKRKSSGADLLVLHLSIDAELARYWRYVYDEAWPHTATPGDAGFMLRNKTYTSQTFHRLHGLVPQLTKSLGEPLYRDALIVAWRL